MEGEVVAERPHGDSYVVETDAGRTTIRNRSHIRPEVGTEECADAAIPAAPLAPRRSERLQGRSVDDEQPSTSLRSIFTSEEWPDLPNPKRDEWW